MIQLLQNFSEVAELCGVCVEAKGWILIEDVVSELPELSAAAFKPNAGLLELSLARVNKRLVKSLS